MRVLIPSALHSYTGGPRVEAEGKTVGEVLDDLDVFNLRVRTPENFDRPAIGVEKPILGNRHVGLHLPGALARLKTICARDSESADYGVRRNAVPKVNDVIHDRGIPDISRFRELWIRGGQNNFAIRLQPDPVVPFVEPDHRLPFAVWTIFASVDDDRLGRLICRGAVERFLNPVAGINMVAVRLQCNCRLRLENRNECDDEPEPHLASATIYR